MIYDTYKNIPEEILEEFAKIPPAKKTLENYRKAKTDKLRAIFGDKLFEYYGNSTIWLMWYQRIHQLKASEVMAEMGKKGGSVTSETKKKSSAENGKKGGRPQTWTQEKLDEIAALRGQGKTLKQIADIYEVSEGFISKLLKKHLV